MSAGLGLLAPVALARLDALAAEYSLQRDAVASIAALLGVIATDPLAPTTVTDPAVGADVHVADTLVALIVPEVRSATTIADLGSGAGIPGLVLAAVLPTAHVALVESNRRKCEFLARAINAAGIANATPVNDRAESWQAGIGRHDVVTARALAPLNVVAEYAAPLLRVGGLAVAWTGRRDPASEARTLRAARILGLSAPDIRPVVPFVAAEHRHLQLMRKLRETPPAYPRRAGIARKRPLGGDADDI